jgi:hypothetical protein
MFGSCIRASCAVVLFAGVVCVGWFGVAEVSSNTRKGTPGAPLWKALPTSSFAVLGQDLVGRQQWGVYGFRSRAGRAALRPCIEIVSLKADAHGYSVLQGGPVCGPLVPPGDEPVVARTVFGKGSVTAVAVGLDVDRVVLDLEPGPFQGRKTRLLTPAQAAKAHVGQFRYVVLPINRKACLRSLSGFSASGDQLFATASGGC